MQVIWMQDIFARAHRADRAFGWAGYTGRVPGSGSFGTLRLTSLSYLCAVYERFLGWLSRARDGSAEDDDVAGCKLFTSQVARFRTGGPLSNERTVGDLADANTRNVPVADYDLEPVPSPWLKV